jgi:hypothetical protein
MATGSAIEDSIAVRKMMVIRGAIAVRKMIVERGAIALTRKSFFLRDEEMGRRDRVHLIQWLTETS